MSEIQVTEVSEKFTIATDDGYSLAARRWDAGGQVVANIGLIHGLGEHSGRYQELAHWLTRARYRVTSFDHRGHGLTHGKRGHVDNYALLLNDIDCLVNQLTDTDPSLPCFLYGHSLGGNLVLNYAIRRQPSLTGLVISSPLLELTTAPPIWKRTVVRLLNCAWPSLTMNTGVRAINMAHDPAAVELNDADPLIHRRVSARLALQMLEAGHWALEHADKLAVPLLLMHGAEDKITSPTATQSFAEHAGAPCELFISEQGYHQLHREANREATFQLIIAWLNARVNAQNK